MTVCIDQLTCHDGDGEWAISSPPMGPAPRPGRSLSTTGTLNERRRRTVLDTIEQSVEAGATGEQLAASVGLSKGAFHRAFKATFGTTPFRYLTQRRVEAAAALMVETTLSLGAIAVDCGFYDQAHLCRQFRKAYGESPTSFRLKNDGARERRHDPGGMPTVLRKMRVK